MRLLRTACWATVACALLSLAKPAEADWIRNGVGIASPGHTVTFDEIGLPALTFVTDQYAGLGVTIAPPFLQGYDAPTPPNYAGISGGFLSNFDFGAPAHIHDPFAIRFNAPVTAAAFVLATNPPTGAADVTKVYALLHGVLIAGPALAYTFSTLPDFAYLGLEGILFDEFRIDVQSNGATFLDNVQFTYAPVPEPTLTLLFGTGIAGMLTRMRRKRAAQVGR